MTYDIEYSALRYHIRLQGKSLKDVQQPMQMGEVRGAEAARVMAISDIEHLRGMDEE